MLPLAASLAAAPLAAAQGSLATQGFGYPAGGLSTHAAAGGGAFAEFDYASVRNPSSLLGWGRGGMYFQYDPEFRSVRVGDATDRTTTARFPLVIAAVQAGSRAMLTFSSTTLLDRTWATRIRGGQMLGPDSVGYEERVQSTGAINDLRFALAYSLHSSLSVGVGIHGYTGENRMSLLRQFDDSVKYGTLFRSLTIGYSGTAWSLGATWRPHRTVAVGASARAGGGLNLRIGDSLSAQASIPHRMSAAVRFDGLPGASLALSVERTTWSRMGGLSESSLVARDGLDYGVGAELLGPRLRGFPSILYLGYRQRDLPFSTSNDVSERVISSGLGLPLAGPRALLDIAMQRASRGPLAGIEESAWILSVGFTVRP
jgi:hypothetical protein